jgi:hypothetical protein
MHKYILRDASEGGPNVPSRSWGAHDPSVMPNGISVKRTIRALDAVAGCGARISAAKGLAHPNARAEHYLPVTNDPLTRSRAPCIVSTSFMTHTLG